MKTNLRLPEEFIKNNRSLIASSVSSEEAAYLTALLIPDQTVPNDPIMADRLSDRGLVKKCNNGIRVTDIGMDAVSMHPLLGEPDSSSYPVSVFPFLLSIVASGNLTVNRSKIKRFLSKDFLSSLFPIADLNSIKKAAFSIVNGYIELGIARIEGENLFLNKDAAISFMSLNLYEKLSLLMRPRGKPSNDLFCYMTMKSTSGAPKKFSEDELRNFGILPGSAYGIKPFEGAVISSDFTLTISGMTDVPVYLFCYPVKSDRLDTYRITKESVRASLSMGFTSDEIKKALKRLSVTIPGTVSERIDSWSADFSSFSTERCTLIRTNESAAKVLSSVPSFENEVIRKLSETEFLMKSESEITWRKIIRESGFDMLGDPYGLPSDRSRSEITEYRTYGGAPLFRKIPYNPSSRKPKNGDDLLSFVIADQGFFDMTAPFTDLKDMSGEEKSLFIRTKNMEYLFVETSASIGYVGCLRMFDEERILINGEVVEISDITRIAEVPAYFNPSVYRKKS